MTEADLQDFSTCTFLFQDDVGGLEVEDPVSYHNMISL
jgi:isopenicillin N synthase-like dioxygenase